MSQGEIKNKLKETEEGQSLRHCYAMRTHALNRTSNICRLLAVITKWTVKDVLIVAVYVEVLRVPAQRYPRNTPISRQQVVSI